MLTGDAGKPGVAGWVAARAVNVTAGKGVRRGDGGAAACLLGYMYACVRPRVCMGCGYLVGTYLVNVHIFQM